jgi:hypothetical protein
LIASNEYKISLVDFGRVTVPLAQLFKQILYVIIFIENSISVADVVCVRGGFVLETDGALHEADLGLTGREKAGRVSGGLLLFEDVGIIE